MQPRTLIRFAAIGAMSCTSAARSEPGVFHRAVARTGDVAPGTDGRFLAFGYPRMNDRGEIAFSAAIDATTGASGIWSEGETGVGQMSIVVRERENIPGAVGLQFGSFAPDPSGQRFPEVNARGSVAFDFRFQNGDSEGSGIAAHIDGELHVVARTDDTAPGAVGASFDALRGHNAFSNNDALAFRATLKGEGVGSTADDSVWMWERDALRLVAREGEPAVTASGYTFGPLGAPTLTDDHRVTFTSIGQQNGNTSWGLLSGAEDHLQLLAQEGDPAPIAGSGVLHGAPIGRHSVNTLGDTLFTQNVVTNGLTLGGLWIVQSGEVHPVAVVGEVAPLGDYYISVTNFTGSISGDGDVVYGARFAGGVSSSQDSAIFKRLASGVTVVLAREGDPAPGLESGAVFGECSIIPLDGTNREGHAVFRNFLRGPAVTEENNFSLWATTSADGPVLLIREGQLLDLGAGDMRQVADAGFIVGVGAESGIRTGLNGAGQVALRVLFTDATEAIVIASIAADCIGDIDGDLEVGFADLNVLLGAFNQIVGNTDARDLDRDGEVDFADLTLLLSAFNTACDS